MLRNFLRFWSQEQSLSALLVVVIIERFVLFPIFGGGRFVWLIADLVFSLFLLAGLRSMACIKAIRVFFSLFVVLGVMTHYAWKLFDLHFLAGWSSLFSILAVMGMLMVTLWRWCIRTDR